MVIFKFLLFFVLSLQRLCYMIQKEYHHFHSLLQVLVIIFFPKVICSQTKINKLQRLKIKVNQNPDVLF